MTCVRVVFRLSAEVGSVFLDSCPSSGLLHYRSANSVRYQSSRVGFGDLAGSSGRTKDQMQVQRGGPYFEGRTEALVYQFLDVSPL